jgi:hypothetical protein
MAFGGFDLKMSNTANVIMPIGHSEQLTFVERAFVGGINLSVKLGHLAYRVVAR